VSWDKGAFLAPFFFPPQKDRGTDRPFRSVEPGRSLMDPKGQKFSQNRFGTMQNRLGQTVLLHRLDRERDRCFQREDGRGEARLGGFKKCTRKKSAEEKGKKDHGSTNIETEQIQVEVKEA